MSLRSFLRKVFRATSDGMSQAGYPESVSGGYPHLAELPTIIVVDEDVDEVAREESSEDFPRDDVAR